MDGPLNTNPWKKEADAAKEAGLTPVGKPMGDQAKAMAASVLAHPEAGHIIQTGKCEISGFWLDADTGVLRKCRPDVWNADLGIIADLKYIDDASEDGFARQCMKMRYHLQSAYYLEGWSTLIGKKLTRHVHILVEDKPPYAVQLHALSDHDLAASAQSIKRNIARYAECMAKNEWPGYPAGVKTMILPQYAYEFSEEGEVIG
jgi:exodeoxyribonuclease VIII